MKTNVNSWVLFILLIVAQLIITNYIHLSQFVVLTLLPAIIVCLPTSLSPIATMLVAFATGLSVDLLAEGVIGLNTVSILPVALLRNKFIGWTMGEDVVVRKAEFSIRRNGLGKTLALITMSLGLFLIIFITTDSAGTRSFWFNSARFVASLLCSTVLCMIVTGVLNNKEVR